MSIARQRLGRQGEELVARGLSARGWRLLARNARVPGVRGELDIVAVDPAGELVFVEVKTVRAGAVAGPRSPLEQVGARKQAQLRRLAGAWTDCNRAELPACRGIRIDVVGLAIDDTGAIVSREYVRAAC